MWGVGASRIGFISIGTIQTYHMKVLPLPEDFCVVITNAFCQWCATNSSNSMVTFSLYVGGKRLFQYFDIEGKYLTTILSLSYP